MCLVKNLALEWWSSPGGREPALWCCLWRNSVLVLWMAQMFLVMSLNLTEEWMMSLVTCKECIQLVQWTMMVILLMLRAACRE